MHDRHFNITAHWSVKSFACESACIKKLQPESKWQMYTNSMYIQEARCPKSTQKCHTVWRELVRDWRAPVGILQLQNTVFACFHCWFLMSNPAKWHGVFFSFLIVAILWMKMKTKGVHFLHWIFFVCSWKWNLAGKDLKLLTSGGFLAVTVLNTKLLLRVHYTTEAVMTVSWRCPTRRVKVQFSNTWG